MRCCTLRSCLVSHYWSLELTVIGVGLAVGLASLPDVDQPLSRIRHRGPTHTVWFAVLVGLLAGVGSTLVLGSSLAFRFGFVVGTCSILAHLAGDVVTPMGNQPTDPALAETRHFRPVQVEEFADQPRALAARLRDVTRLAGPGDH